MNFINENSLRINSFDYEMPARRRFPGSESDDNFSVLIDGGNVVISDKGPEIIDSPYSGDEKKKYVTTTGTKLIQSGYSIAGFSVPTGITKLSSSIGNFLQQQITEVNNVINVEQNNSPLNSSAVTTNSNSFIDNDTDCDIGDEIIIMASRDRTNEFFNAIRSMQGRNIARAVNIRDPRKATQLQSYSEFMMIAKHIGKNIASTYSKLEKLTLCKFELKRVDQRRPKS